MGLLIHRYVARDTPARNPAAVPPPQVARVRRLLGEIVHVRHYGRDFEGNPVDHDPDRLIALINRAEAVLARYPGVLR